MKLKDLIELKATPTFYMLCGVPGAGKSTAIKKIQQMNPDAVVVCPDEYRKQLGGTYNHFADDDKIWNVLCPNDVNETINSGQSVIFDATNVTAKRRKSILNWIKAPAKKVAVVVEVPLAVALKQNQQRDPDKVVPDDVIKRMFDQFEYPTTSEGFDEVINSTEL